MNCTVIALLRVTLMNFVEIHKKMCDKIKTFHIQQMYESANNLCPIHMRSNKKICHPFLVAINLIENNL